MEQRATSASTLYMMGFTYLLELYRWISKFTPKVQSQEEAHFELHVQRLADTSPHLLNDIGLDSDENPAHANTASQPHLPNFR